MKKSMLFLLLPAMAAVSAASRYLGGWAVVTVDELPDYATVRQPLKLSFIVRQHGMRPLDGLQPRVEAKSGKVDMSVDALPVLGAGSGRYVATLSLPQPGDWTVTIHSGFGAQSEPTLLPLPVVDSRTAPPRAFSDADRGRRLFIAKGCFTCHVNTEVTNAQSMNIGPDLTGRRYPAEPLAKFLAHPDSIQLTRVTRPSPWKMPNLGLTEREIASLVAMINGGRQVSVR